MFRFDSDLPRCPRARLSLSATGPNSIVLWAHTAATWYVVTVTMGVLEREEREFLQRRREWLLHLPVPRATTILVRGVPEESRPSRGQSHRPETCREGPSGSHVHFSKNDYHGPWRPAAMAAESAPAARVRAPVSARKSEGRTASDLGCSQTTPDILPSCAQQS